LGYIIYNSRWLFGEDRKMSYRDVALYLISAESSSGGIKLSSSGTG